MLVLLCFCVVAVSRRVKILYIRLEELTFVWLTAVATVRIHKYLPTISDCLRAGAVTCLGSGSSKAAAPKRKSWVRRCAGGQLERCVHDSDVNE